MTSRKICFTLQNSNSLATLFTTNIQEEDKIHNEDESINFIQLHRLLIPGGEQESLILKKTVPQKPLPQKPSNKGKFVQKSICKKLKPKGSQKLACYKEIKRRIFQINKSRLHFKPETNPLVPFKEVISWMMEVAALLRAPKENFYHAVLIFTQAHAKEPTLCKSKSVQTYVCAALTIAIKFDSGQFNVMEAIYQVMGRKIRKEDIFKAQLSIHQIMKWKIPYPLSLVEKQTLFLEAWNQFVEECREDLEAQNIFGKLTMGPQQKYQTKLLTEFMLVLDQILLTNLVGLEERTIIRQCVIALYIVMAMHIGDLYQHDSKLWQFFRRFAARSCNNQQLLGMRKEMQDYFLGLNLAENLSRIPLCMNCQKDIKEGLQTDRFIPNLYFILVGRLRKIALVLKTKTIEQLIED